MLINISLSKESFGSSPEVEEDLSETETHEVTIEDVGAEAEQDVEYEEKNQVWSVWKNICG